MHFLGHQRIFINTRLYVMAISVGKNGIFFYFKAKVAYTFSPTEEKLNQQLPTKKKGNKVWLRGTILEYTAGFTGVCMKML